MRKQFLFLFVTALAVFTACKKDTDKPGPETPSQTKVLKRIVETEGNVTTTHTLLYDASKRLVSMTSSDDQLATLFTYNDKGNLVKAENRVEDVTNVFTFTYENNLPVSGSFKSFERSGSEDILTESYTLFYTLSNGVVSKIKAVFPDPDNAQQTSEVEYNLTYSNGNVAAITATGLMQYSATFTYGNKKPVYPNVLPYVLDPAGFTAQYAARNEILSIAYNLPGTENDETITNTYTYDTQGYVLTANDGQTQSRFEYE